MRQIIFGKLNYTGIYLCIYILCVVSELEPSGTKYRHAPASYLRPILHGCRGKRRGQWFVPLMLYPHIEHLPVGNTSREKGCLVYSKEHNDGASCTTLSSGKRTLWQEVYTPRGSAFSWYSLCALRTHPSDRTLNGVPRSSHDFRAHCITLLVLSQPRGADHDAGGWPSMRT